MYELTLSLPPRTRTVLRDGHIIKVRTPADVLQECGDLVHAGQELFIGLFLNTRNNLIDKRILGLGTGDSCLITPTEIFSVALQCRAPAVIIAHNHPSGDTLPSSEDLRITRQLVDAGKVLNISVLDHIIVGYNDAEQKAVSISLRESGMVAFG